MVEFNITSLNTSETFPFNRLYLNKVKKQMFLLIKPNYDSDLKLLNLFSSRHSAVIKFKFVAYRNFRTRLFLHLFV